MTALIVLGAVAAFFALLLLLPVGADVAFDEGGPQVALRHEHLADGPAVGQKAVEIGREEAVDAGLPAPARNGPQEFVQRGLLLGASHREAAAQPYKLADGRIQHGKRLPHGAVELRLAGRDGRKARAERALRPAAQLRRRRRDALLFSKHVFPPLLGETLNRSSAADAGSFSAIHRYEKLEIHKVFLRFPYLDLPKKSLAIRSC